LPTKGHSGGICSSDKKPGARLCNNESPSSGGWWANGALGRALRELLLVWLMMTMVQALPKISQAEQQAVQAPRCGQLQEGHELFRQGFAA